MNVSQTVLPNFLVIGAQRCATSWLYFCLREHPDIYLPFIKEVKFFNRNYEKGLDWYRRYFSLWRGQKAVGEISPSYLYTEGTAERIAAGLPGVRLIVCLRNPVTRAFSQYQKHMRAGAAHSDFEAALKKNPEFVDRGFYFRQLERYLAVFERKRILVLIYEDIARDPAAFLRSIFAFLGVDPAFVPPEAAREIPSEELDAGLYGRLSPLSSFLRHQLGLGGVIDALKRSPARLVFDRFFDATSRARGENAAPAAPRETMDPRTRAMLARTFEEENRKLAAFLERDLSFWN